MSDAAFARLKESIRGLFLFMDGFFECAYCGAYFDEIPNPDSHLTCPVGRIQRRTAELEEERKRK